MNSRSFIIHCGDLASSRCNFKMVFPINLAQHCAIGRKPRFQCIHGCVPSMWVGPAQGCRCRGIISGTQMVKSACSGFRWLRYG